MTLSNDTLGTYYPSDSDLALADKIARLPVEQRNEIMSGLTTDLAAEALAYDFSFWGRPSQLDAMNSTTPFIAMLAGRGYGKTRSLAQWVHKKAMEMPGSRGLLVGRVTSDVRDVIIMGESGILNVTPPSECPRYVATMRRIVWPNGSEAMTFSADLPDQLRGPQGHWAACDELGSWRQRPSASSMGIANAWDQVKIATRLGANPQIFVATTPRRVPTIRDILKIAQETPHKMTLIRGSTTANRHLSPEYLDTMLGMYAGTSLAAQELDGLLLGDTDGALLNMDLIDEYRDLAPPPISSLPLRVVGLDPSVAENPNDECGIVLAGATGEREPFRRHAYIYEDWSLKGGPNQWAKAATALAKQHNAVIVAEQNQGVELVRMVLTAADPTVPVILVRAQQGKQLRAEPVILAYEQGRVHHADYFPQLEDQYTTWVPAESKYSPDRVDAAVHALTALLVKAPVGFDGGVRTSRRQSRSMSMPVRSGAIPVTSIVQSSDPFREQALAAGAVARPFSVRPSSTGRGNAAAISQTSPRPRRRMWRRRNQNETAPDTSTES